MYSAVHAFCGVIQELCLYKKQLYTCVYIATSIRAAAGVVKNTSCLCAFISFISFAHSVLH